MRPFRADPGSPQDLGTGLPHHRQLGYIDPAYEGKCRPGRGEGPRSRREARASTRKGCEKRSSASPCLARWGSARRTTRFCTYAGHNCITVGGCTRENARIALNRAGRGGPEDDAHKIMERRYVSGLVRPSRRREAPGQATHGSAGGNPSRIADVRLAPPA